MNKHRILIAILILALAMALSACRSDEIQTEDFVVTPVPTQQPLANRPEVTGGIVTAMRENTEWALTGEHFQPYQAVTLDDGETVVEFLTLYLVSSGIFDQTTITLEDGSTYRMDAVYAYQLNHARGVIAIPLVIGFEDENGGYTYFANNYVSDNLIDGKADLLVLTRLTADEARQDAAARLPAGTVVSLTANNVLGQNSLDWENCLSKRASEFPSTYCHIAAQIDRGYTDTIINRAATRLPDDWVMVGWFFSERPEYGIVPIEE